MKKKGEGKEEESRNVCCAPRIPGWWGGGGWRGGEARVTHSLRHDIIDKLCLMSSKFRPTYSVVLPL